MNYEVSVEKTAITNGVSNSCKMLVKSYESGKVLDYGFGRLRNAKYMLKENINLDLLDTCEQIEKNKEELSKLNIDNIYKSDDKLKESSYDRILLSFVLNVVPEISDREFILNNIYLSLKSDGLLYLEVRDDKFIKTVKTKIKHNDGFVLGTGKKRTFQRPYNLDDISEFLISNGFEINESKKHSGSIVLVCKKK